VGSLTYLGYRADPSLRSLPEGGMAAGIYEAGRPGLLLFHELRCDGEREGDSLSVERVREFRDSILHASTLTKTKPIVLNPIIAELRGRTSGNWLAEVSRLPLVLEIAAS
jgi:hypothetical protein